MPLGTDVGLGLCKIVFDVDPCSYPQKKGHTHPCPILAHVCIVYCAQMAGWTKTPLGTAVDLGPGHIVLDGVSASFREKGTAAPPLFLAHVYCGHGRPSQLLLSSCYIMKLCSRLFVLYCRNCPKDDKFRYFIPILRKLGAA